MATTSLAQNDPRWENTVLGFGQSDQTIGKFGCLLTSMAIIGNYYGGNETPASLNEKMKAQKAFQGPWVKAFKINKAFPNVNYQKHITTNNQPAPMDEIDAALQAGSLVAVNVDYSPAAGVQGHWVVVHQKQGDDYAIWDPYNNPDAPDTLVGRYGFSGTPSQIVQEAIVFGPGSLPETPPADEPDKTPAPKQPRSVPQAKKAPSTSSAAEFYVKPTTNGLTMRSQPMVHPTNLMKYLSNSDKLLVLEDEAAARPKIGEMQQWLHVRDVEGDEGYVAAWYVTAVDDPAMGPFPTYAANLPSTPSKLIVKVNASSLSFRTAPRIASNTLISYLKRGTELQVVEEGGAAKIGQSGQWLQVKATNGKVGYVAAWLVVQK